MVVIVIDIVRPLIERLYEQKRQASGMLSLSYGFGFPDWGVDHWLCGKLFIYYTLYMNRK